MRKNNKQKSFTLIELMTVVGIIAILAGLMLVGYNIFFNEADIGSGLRFDSSIHYNLGYALVGDWKLDDNETNSTIVDSSGNNNNCNLYSSGVEENSSSNSVDGVNNRALYFDGDNEINCGSKDSFDITKAITISTWAKVNNNVTGSDGAVYKREAYAIRVHQSYPDQDTWQMMLHIDGSWHGGDYPPVNENQWDNLVLTYNSRNKTKKVYVNGKLYGETTYSGFDNYTINSLSSELKIGLNMHGVIDQMRIFKETLSSYKIKQQYYTGLQRLYKKGLISREEYIKRIVKK